VFAQLIDGLEFLRDYNGFVDQLYLDVWTPDQMALPSERDGRAPISRYFKLCGALEAYEDHSGGPGQRVRGPVDGKTNDDGEGLL
jgi:hypothetical protein